MSKDILIVEDDKSCSDLYKMRFEIAGYHVTAVPSAEQAIDVIKQKKPAAILLDLMLPKMQGEEFLDLIRSNKNTADLKVLVLTALSLNNEKFHKICSAADDCMLKIDVMPKDLVARVEKLLS